MTTEEYSNIKSWIEVPVNSDFPIQNIPFGIASPKGKLPRPATRIGDMVIDLSVLDEYGFFDNLGIEDHDVFKSTYLNDFIELGNSTTGKVRKRLIEIFREGNSQLHSLNNQGFQDSLMYDINEVKMEMPVIVGDYTDFYSSIEHATNVGKMFRDSDNALLPNWKHIPVGYHGRSSSIVISGTDIHRPKGQTLPAGFENPVFGPSKLMDFELEMAFITSKKTNLGEPVTVENARDAIFGMVLFNDLSARDIQKWEYVPLGPFLGKNFGSVISPWIVTLDALQPFFVESPAQFPEVLPYLKQSGKNNIDIKLQVGLRPDDGKEDIICNSNFNHMYWSIYQQLAHQTVNGCNVNVGDMYGSGTISGSEPDSFGSMLELSWNGKKPIKLSNGTERNFLNDNDTVIMRGWAENNLCRIGFGECVTKIIPAK